MNVTKTAASQHSKTYEMTVTALMTAVTCILRVPDPVPDAGEGRQDPAREGRHSLGAAGGRAAHRGWAQPQGRVHHDDDGQR